MSRHHAIVRFVVMLVVGVVVTIAVGLTTSWLYAGIAGWAGAALVYTSWVRIAVGRFDGDQTRAHAVQEEPARGVSETLIVALSLASLAGLGVVLALASSASGTERFVIAALAIVSVALSWLMLHTLFMLRYARLYYRDTPGGIDFNQDIQPRYSDFAYLAFTVGMTYQISDTDLSDQDIRSTVLRHSLLSFVFGAVILATTINLIAGLGS